MGRRATATRRQGGPLGFSLLELMIALAILFVITAIALPRLVTARNRANEASAIISLRTIHTAETIYQNNYPAKGYSASLVNLGNNGSICETSSPTNACLIDSVLASGTKDGYLFDLLGDGRIPDMTYTLKAVPSSSGDCAFSTDQSGVVQYGLGAPVPGLTSGGGSGGGSSRCSGNVN